VTAICLAAAAGGVGSLPSRCGEVGRPNVDSAAKGVLAAAAFFWLIGLASFAPASRTAGRWSRFALSVVALFELGAGIAVLIWYGRHTAWYDHCG
jgi:hypothetical protein